MEDGYTEYKNKLFNIINAVDYFVHEYSKKWASDFNWGEVVKHYEALVIKKKIIFCLCIHKMYLISA